MLITLLAPGTRGDVQPYLALGKTLKKRDLGVRVATFSIFETFVKQHGLEYFPLHGDISQVASSETGREAMQADNPLKLLLSFNALKGQIFELQKELFDACRGRMRSYTIRVQRLAILLRRNSRSPLSSPPPSR